MIKRKTERACRTRRIRIADSTPLIMAMTAAVSIAATNSVKAYDNNAHGHNWYVSATAAAVGIGTASAPFNTLAKVQQASGPGDTIIVVPSPLSAPPLDGGIVLKPGQRLIGGGPPVVKSGEPLIPDGPPVVGSAGLSLLPRIANTTAAGNGDAVRLADNTEVENLVITGASRGAIYGLDVVGVRVRGNDISGFNTSGTFGFLVQPFDLETFTAGVGRELATGVQAGWASILIDAANVRTTLAITDNYIHDGVCGNGIDVRGMNKGEISVLISSNFITRLLQCSSVRAVHATSTQVTGTSRLQATLFGNSQAQIGSPGADAEGVFVNPAESGTLIETVDRNVYITGIGGASTNGFEYILSNGNAKSRVTISNSFFRDNPGDMLEVFNYGAGSETTLVLDNVTVEQTTISVGVPSYATPPGTAGQTGNLGECLTLSSDGANDSTTLLMTNSSFTGCDNNGIQVTGNHATGNGDGDLHNIVVEIDNSTISGSRFYNLWVNAVTPLTNLKVRVQDSDLSQSSSGVPVAFDQQPTGATANAVIDLGGGALGSDGRNCIFGGAIFDLEAARYMVVAEHNWWGSANGPMAGKVVETVPGFLLNASSPLRRAPPACNTQDEGNRKHYGQDNGNGR
jgi:hypothetical protein